MESNRFGGNNKLFIFGMLCLAISLGLFIFSLYLLPYFIFEWSYNVPDFILNLLAMYQDDYQYSSAGSKTVVWLLFFVPCVITGLISYFISRYFDNKMYGIPASEEPEKSSIDLKKEIKESASIGGKILGLMVAIVVVILLLQYFVQSTS